MALKECGRVQDGGIVLSKRLNLADGTEVIVHIEPTAELPARPLPSLAFVSLSFFGMWSDREDMRDSAAWVEREREKWQHRLSPVD